MARSKKFENQRTNTDVKYYGTHNLTEIDLYTEYINSTLSLQELAKKYEIPYRTVKTLSRLGGWADNKRKRSKDLAIGVNDLVEKDLVKLRAKLITKNYEQLEKTQLLIDKTINRLLEKGGYNVNELLCLTKVFKNINDICIGNDVNTEHSSENTTLSKLDTLIDKIRDYS